MFVVLQLTGCELQQMASSMTRAVSYMIQHAPQLFHIPEPLVRDIAQYWKQMEETENSEASRLQRSRSDDELDSSRVSMHHVSALFRFFYYSVGKYTANNNPF